MQDEDESYYFVANLHALTTVRDPKLLAGYTLDAAIDLLALGLDPKRATLFVQSDVPEVSELCWLLLTGTPMGLLERCHAYKDKKAKGLTADAGLFTYPVLMAADILAYDADTVPVGDDQLQHIEVSRDLAASFNHHFGETFTLPKAKILDTSAKVPGTDGEKMSKSYNNTLEIFEDPKQQRKKIMRITTDSRPMDQPKDPFADHLFQLYSLVATPEERESMAALYNRGGFGYGDVKKALADAAERYFAEARSRAPNWPRNPKRFATSWPTGPCGPAARLAGCWCAPRKPAGWLESISVRGASSGDLALRLCFGTLRSMNRIERNVIWFVAGTLAAAALAWVAFELQQDGIAPAVLFPLAVGAALGLSLVAVRRFTEGPNPRAAIVAAIVWGLLLVVAQDYIGHWHRLRQFDEQIGAGHPLAMAVADDLRPTLAGDVSARIRARPVWWTLDLMLTAGAAGLVTALGARRKPPGKSPTGSDRDTVAASPPLDAGGGDAE